MDSFKLLAVFAHPDDESMGMGGMPAKYPAEETFYRALSLVNKGSKVETDFFQGLR